MTKELGDVLGAAESATERSLPAFDHVVMARTATQKANRRRTRRAMGTTLLAAASLGLVGVGGYVAYDRLGGVDPISQPSPSLSGAPSPNPTVTVGEVAVGDGLPSAVPLTSNVLETSGTGWVLALFDSTYRPGSTEPIQGERILYLVSPTGDRYQVADLTQYGEPQLLAWDTEREVAFFQEGRYMAFTVDLATGQILHEWQMCGEAGYITAKDRPGDQWLVRGNCSGQPLDGIYGDDGTLITREGIVQSGEGITMVDVGDTQVRYEFEMPPAQSYVAYHADGTQVAVKPVGDTVGCYPMGPAVGGGIAVQCWGEGDDVSIWSLDLNGGDAIPIANANDLAALDTASGGTLPATGATIAGYVSAGDYGVITTTHPAAAVLQDLAPIQMNDGTIAGTSCYGGVGTTVLMQGSGELWTWNGSTNTVVTLLPVPASQGDGTWVGAAEGGAIIHP